MTTAYCFLVEDEIVAEALVEDFGFVKVREGTYTHPYKSQEEAAVIVAHAEYHFGSGE